MQSSKEIKMPMVRAMRLLNAIEAGTTNGAALESLLAHIGF